MSLTGRLWEYLLKQFMIRRLDELVQERRSFALPWVRWYARFALGMYLIAVPIMVIGALTVRNVPAVVGVIFCVLLFPFMARVVLSVQINLWVGPARKPANKNRQTM